MPDMNLQEERLVLEDDAHNINELFFKAGWTDGLPILPPTEQVVAQMIKGSGRPGNAVIGKIPPRWAEATVEKIATNCVMAGCKPEYMPVILAAVEAMLDEKFNLHAVQATTHPCAPLIIVNGPIRKELGVNCGYGVFGPGWRANATIGRAIRLILLNIGGGSPGELDRSTLGHPGKYTFCIGENEEESPWTPLHVEKGFRKEDNVVTVIPADAPHDVLDRSSNSAHGVLSTCAGSLAALGKVPTLFISESILAFCPEHAATVAREGWTKDAVKQFMCENAGVEIEKYGPEVGVWRREQLRRENQSLLPDGRVPVIHGKDKIILIVTGGGGKHSAILGAPAAMQAVTREIRKPVAA